MSKKKNEARLFHSGEPFVIWQDENDKWNYRYQLFEAVNTDHKELQLALNIAYEDIEDKRPKNFKRKWSAKR